MKLFEITIDDFSGGIASDLLNARKGEFALTKHFDISNNKLEPYRDMEDEAGTLGVYAIKSVVLFTDSAAAQNLYALGNVSGQTYPQVIEKSSNMVTGTFAISTTGAGSVGTVVAISLFPYRTKLFGLNLDTTVKLFSYDPQSNTYVAAVGDTAKTTSGGIYPRMFRHPQDDILYIGVGNQVSTLNNATFTAAALTLPVGFVITSFCDYGTYLAIACAPIDQSNKSYTFLWNRDTSLTTVSEVIDFGEGSLMVLDNVGGSLVGISVTSQATASVFDIAPKVVFREYTGGLARTWKEIQWTTTGASTLLLKNLKAKKDDKLFFALKTYMENQTVFQVWVVGKNASGRLYATADRYVNNDTAITAIDGLDVIGDYLWVGYNGDGSLKRTNDAATFTATPTYDSAILNGGDSNKVKHLDSVVVTFEALPADGIVSLYYRLDEQTTYTRILKYGVDNALSYGAFNIENATAGGDTVTMTQASPCVVTLTAHKLLAGQSFKFTTSGALYTGITAEKTYYVKSTGLTANTFQFSATAGTDGTAVNTTGTQSGTHKLDRTANLPDFKEIQFRIESVGGAVITGLKVKYSETDKQKV